MSKDKLAKIYLWIGGRNRRLMALDLLLLLFSVFVGYSMRLSYYMGADFLYLYDFLGIAALFSLMVLSSLTLCKIYSVFWPRAGIDEYFRLARAYLAGAAAFVVAAFTIRPFTLPRSSLVIMLLAAPILLVSERAALRLALMNSQERPEGRESALIVGAGEAGSMLARDLLRNSGSICPAGFVDDNEQLRNMTVASLKVLGTTKELKEIIAKHDIDTVLIAIPSAPGEKIKELFGVLSPLRVKVRVLPSLSNLADGRVSISRLRSVNLEDLLRREPIRLDDENITSLIKGKSVLVTGAGGSIGSEICRQLLPRAPKRLIALGHGEQSIYMLLESLGGDAPVVPVIADVADAAAMESVFKDYAPQLVFHASAHKHVPLMEKNPREALRVNALGTYNAARLAGRYGALRFVMISTDKAVRPTSVMGATKRAAERLLLSVQKDHPLTKYMAVRFGNVLGSRGSVVPKFERQIAAGGPVTVTHPEMKRYFMLIPEAVSLVLQAGAMGEGGELFALDMGEPVRIAEMAETLIRLHGYEPGRDIQIKYTGIREGEKLYEELFYDPSHADRTAHAKIFKSRLTPEAESILPQVVEILRASAEGTLSGERLKERIFSLGRGAEAENEEISSDEGDEHDEKAG
ncbi:polysaccharide biosynthesis protein [Synergistes jonesii]|uniref:Capsule biosynthesis protein CapD n=1 Tax=Synergistes jonesii TaxID=2754 RepID=A0A073J755_9BACT|nr:nucleoside-diphosphate sugar epimerase/dehydratase [Synergistes jonesii]KEJ93532.1 capsule biosynthesis protein CapD [Synergistes jonesii]